jgi:SagB-type dehydrogenase family enzyme
MTSIEDGRQFLKADLWEAWDTLDTDQERGLPPPPPQKPYPPDAPIFDLTPPEKLTVGNMPLIETIKQRRSQRTYTGEPLTLEELSFLLWATQGVTHQIRGGQTILRTVPSAGARHPFETYLLVNKVLSLDTGLYRYLSLEHKLCLLSTDENLVQRIHLANYEQYVLDSAVVFIWTVLPYRTEWRYSLLSHKMIAQDAGHICQNLYLACESLGIGSCAIGAYNQKMIDAVIGVDGFDEFTIYVATVGRVT